MKKIRIATLGELDPAKPAQALVANVDLVIVRWPDEDEVSVLYGRCLHRGALLCDGEVRGEDLICGVHGWDYRFRTGVSAYTNEDGLAAPACQPMHDAWIENGAAIDKHKSLGEWLRLSFFKDVHLKMYEKRPIYFPLSSAARNFVALVSIHRWADDTLQTLLADYEIGRAHV